MYNVYIICWVTVNWIVQQRQARSQRMISVCNNIVTSMVMCLGYDLCPFDLIRDKITFGVLNVFKMLSIFVGW